MILPLPVAPDTGDDGVSFIDLSDCAHFFEKLDEYFPRRVPASATAGSLGSPTAALSEPPLVVHEVGSFDASYVPSIEAFSRLDERFRLSNSLWSELPQYARFGFAVFKLQQGREQHIHPMAFRFPTRHRGKLFFPTLHIHDRHVPDEARFDHRLYGQGEMLDVSGWPRSARPVKADNSVVETIVFDQSEAEYYEKHPEELRISSELAQRGVSPRFDEASTKGVVRFGAGIFRSVIRGIFRNQDTIADVAA